MRGTNWKEFSMRWLRGEYQQHIGQNNRVLLHTCVVIPLLPCPLLLGKHVCVSQSPFTEALPLSIPAIWASLIFVFLLIMTAKMLMLMT